MTLPEISLASIPHLDLIPAAHGALLSPVQISGTSVFDIVIAVIIISGG